MIISILSYFIENLVSNFNISANLVVVSLIFLYLFSNKKVYLKYSIILGLFYDILFTSTLFLNTFIFYILGSIILIYFTKYRLNLTNSVICIIIITTIYHLLNFLILLLINYIEFDYILLLTIIIKTLVINIIYFIVINYILKVIKESHI